MNIADYIKKEMPRWPNWINSILLKCNVFGPLVYGRNYLHYFRKISTISPEEKLLNIVNYAIKNVPYYRNRYGSLIISSIQEFEENIAFIDKEEVMSHWDEFLADDVDLSKCIVGTTGGTSGKPLKLVNFNNRYATELFFIHSMWKRVGWNYSLISVIRNHRLPVNRDYLINPITKEIIFDAFRVSPDYVKKIIHILLKYKVRFIHAYPSAAYQFCKICYNENIDISFIKCFLCGSEAVTYEQYHFISQKIGIRIFSWYGHSEKLILGGYMDIYPLIYIEPCYGWFELIDKNNKVISDSNTLGEMVGTTFYNLAMPLIRYRTGDYAKLDRKRLTPSDYVVIKDIHGRWNMNLIFRKNGTSTSITALNLHNSVYEKINGIQYVQNKIGELIVLIIKGENYDKSVESYLYSIFENAMGRDSTVIIKYVDKLNVLPNGKFLPLISNLNI